MSHDNKTEGLSDFQMWILVGFLIGRRLFTSVNREGMYIQLGSGTVISVAREPIVDLVGKQYLKYNNNGTEFALGTLGFNVAYDKLKKAGGTIISSESKKHHPMVKSEILIG